MSVQCEMSGRCEDGYGCEQLSLETQAGPNDKIVK